MAAVSLRTGDAVFLGTLGETLDAVFGLGVGGEHLLVVAAVAA